MNESDDRLELLFAKARAAEPGPSAREEGFEGRLMARLLEQRGEEAPWYLWAWRSVPLFTAVIVALITVCGVQSSGTGASLSHALTSGYEESTLVSYYTGE